MKKLFETIVVVFVPALITLAASVPLNDARSNVSTWLPQWVLDLWPSLNAEAADDWAYALAAVSLVIAFLIWRMWMNKKKTGPLLHDIHVIGFKTGFELDRAHGLTLKDCLSSGTSIPGSKGFVIKDSADVSLRGAVARGHEIGFEVDNSPRADLTDARAENPLPAVPLASQNPKKI